jgi:hypothetical protein
MESWACCWSIKCVSAVRVQSKPARWVREGWLVALSCRVLRTDASARDIPTCSILRFSHAANEVKVTVMVTM